MLKYIDDILNKITMYRLILYFLSFLIFAALVFSFLNILPYDPSMLLFSTSMLIIFCLGINKVFSYVFDAQTNVESAWITALILVLIITPPSSLNDFAYLWFIFWAAVWAMASKYILAINRKHIFNPAAFAVALTALTINQSASWWVGTASLTPLVLIGGILITRKLRHADLVIAFILISVTGSVLIHAYDFSTIVAVVQKTFLYSPLLFFAFVMLTEPLTTPPTKLKRISYGILIGALFDPAVGIAGIFSTPELALCLGNIFSYLISPKSKLLLKLKKREEVAENVYDFTFSPDTDNFSFKPGQYLEWTLGHSKPDSRGNRRYFTIASSPAKEDLTIGVKFYPNENKSSSFKKALMNMEPGDTIMAGQLAGDFTLPKDHSKKLCFIAGGIGATPFKSMISHMLIRGEERDIVMFYSNKAIGDIAYADILEQAKKELGLKIVYTLTDNNIPADWRGERGMISKEMLVKNMPDYNERVFYISGPQAMVDAFKSLLEEIGIPKRMIRTDFFPGFA